MACSINQTKWALNERCHQTWLVASIASIHFESQCIGAKLFLAISLEYFAYAVATRRYCCWMLICSLLLATETKQKSAKKELQISKLVFAAHKDTKIKRKKKRQTRFIWARLTNAPSINARKADASFADKRTNNMKSIWTSHDKEDRSKGKLLSNFSTKTHHAAH